MHDLVSIKHWLQSQKESNRHLIDKCLLFGSILKRCDINDVDVIIVFNEWYVREFIAGLKSNFYRCFGLRLHIQLFHISQSKYINSFVSSASATEEVK